MSVLPPINRPGCKPAYGGCSCACHRWPGVHHCVPCCGPGLSDSMPSIIDWKGEGEDPTQTRDREIVESEEQARSDMLHDLTGRCDNPTMREDAIKSLEGVVEAHRPPEPPVWAGRL